MYQLISMASTVYQMLSWTSALHFQGKRQGGSRDAASLRESLNALSVASLAFPQVHLGLAEVEVEDPRSISKLESQLMAGGEGIQWPACCCTGRRLWIIWNKSGTGKSVSGLKFPETGEKDGSPRVKERTSLMRFRCLPRRTNKPYRKKVLRYAVFQQEQ